MYHALLLPTEVIREMPGLVDSADAPSPIYRSEAFAEDLYTCDVATEPQPVALPGGRLLAATPLAFALLGGLASLLF